MHCQSLHLQSSRPLKKLVHTDARSATKCRPQPPPIAHTPHPQLHPSKRRRLSTLALAAADVSADEAFHWEGPTQAGDSTLIISPLEASEVGAASVVLTRAFATSPQGIPIEDGRKYCENMVKMPPRGVFLVGRLHPNDPSAVDWLVPGQGNSRLVATAAVSFDPVSRDTFQTLSPPDNEAYLCNIAVDPKFRRLGIARQVLAGCEQLAAVRGFQRFYLHVRLGDEAARKLYDSSGYKEVDSDSWLIKLRGLTPASLMVKEFS